MNWLNDLRQHVDSLDNDDLMAWRYGAMCEGEHDSMVAQGLEPGGHSFDMPAWLERQLHFENIVAAVAMRVRYALGAVRCAQFGHPDSALDVQEGGPDSPWVAWTCSCCGNGGQSWW